jgi:NADH-quinone oxidoreductase subunit G
MLISKYKINATVVMEGSFCQGKCNEGVVIKINDEIITNVSREKVYGIFAEKVLAVIK